MNFTTISVEGGLLPPDLLESIAAGDRELPGQKPTDFRIPRGRNLPDVMQRSFAAARDYWNAFETRRNRSGESPTSLTRRYWMEGFLELLEFPRPRFQRSAIEVGNETLVVSHRMHDGEFASPIHIVAWNQSLDERGPQGRHTPHAAVQSYLNGSEALWGLATNGGEMRLLRDSVRLSKPSYLEFNLQAMLEGNLYSEFAVLYRLLHATRFPRPEDSPHSCWLEIYYAEGVERGGRVRDRLRDGVKGALEVLGTAFLRNPANTTLAGAIERGDLTDTDFYRQLLRLVYRLLFLMVTEERKLLFQEAGTGLHTVYSRYYGVGRLRTRAERYFADDLHSDLWEGLKKTFRLFRDDTALGLSLSPLNGELFGPEACQDVEAANLTNEELLKAIRHLSTFDADGIRRRVNYAHLDVEELGSVYESLLDYHPGFTGVERSDAPPGFVLTAGTERKQTGSYYTPPELVRELMESALVPVMAERLGNAGLDATKREEALLSLRICDPACGSGHFLLAATRRIARELARTRTGQDEPDLPPYREAIRDVVRHCVYGVDKNPLAVDLCKVALWIESHAAGYPLGFLDHRIKCGDSLVGVREIACLDAGIPDGAYKTVKGDDKKVASYYRRINKMERQGQRSLAFDDTKKDLQTTFAAESAEVGRQDEQNTADVQAKQELYAELRASDTYTKGREACDLWTYAFFAPLTNTNWEAKSVPTSEDIWHGPVPHLKSQAESASRSLAFFHWPLEFPEVFDNLRGGFDVLLANPPWERIKLQEKEFFAARDPDIAAAPRKSIRQALIDRLQKENPALSAEFAAAVRRSDGIGLFVRTSGRNPLTGKGDVNTYSIFAETVAALLNPSGQAGVIVPTGVAMDNTNKEFFASLIQGRRLVSLYDFENREAVFPDVHRSYKFCLLTLTGSARPARAAEFAFFLHQTAQLREPERRFSLSAEDFALFNPNTRNCPMFRTRRDLEIARKMYRRAGVLWKEAQGDTPAVNPWGITFQRMFDMSNDSGLFRMREELESAGWTLQGNEFVKGTERYLPLYEAKLFGQFDHRFSTFANVAIQDRKKGKARSVDAREKEDPDFAAVPRYWIHEENVRAKFDKAALAVNEIGKNTEHGTRNTEHGTRNTEHGTRNTEHGTRSRPWPPSYAPGLPPNRLSHQREDSDGGNPSRRWHRPFGHGPPPWIVAFRDVARATDRRTAIVTIVPRTAMNNKAPTVQLQGKDWIQALRRHTRATDRRTLITSCVPAKPLGDNSIMVENESGPVAVASALLTANMNSLPLDWAARGSVGGMNLGFFIVKQLPILPPETYLETACVSRNFAELVAERVLELTYTAHDLEPFARALGYEGFPFVWNEERRHGLQSELDAIYAHMYRLDREDLKWILDPLPPSISFSTLQKNEEQEFGEYRTQRLVLQAYDQLAAGAEPDVSGEAG